MDRRSLAAASLLLVAASAVVRRVQQALQVKHSRQNIIRVGVLTIVLTCQQNNK